MHQRPFRGVIWPHRSVCPKFASVCSSLLQLLQHLQATDSLSQVVFHFFCHCDCCHILGLRDALHLKNGCSFDLLSIQIHILSLDLEVKVCFLFFFIAKTMHLFWTFSNVNSQTANRVLRSFKPLKCFLVLRSVPCHAIINTNLAAASKGTCTEMRLKLNVFSRSMGLCTVTEEEGMGRHRTTWLFKVIRKVRRVSGLWGGGRRLYLL